ncbi:hypothetical protein B0H67DRAFT_582056 [Lasiosphaeris hirsuta]|uniref:Uncharacterized protein n=1 Tax=Lasiosphaeris hirsuta TaxID=260670 RepID=A0AA40AHH6_9PEZI|nr:hypothetical protein B0H67DRAFT_582056 [Lasiosphaeris hirsuta]
MTTMIPHRATRGSVKATLAFSWVFSPRPHPTPHSPGAPGHEILNFSAHLGMPPPPSPRNRRLGGKSLLEIPKINFEKTKSTDRPGGLRA